MEAKYDDMVPISLFANRELLDRHNDRLAVFDAATEVTQMQQIVRAVNTFDQAREALKLALDYYRSKGTQKFNPYEVEQRLEKALAAMEATHE